jgi:hypothetical protein
VKRIYSPPLSANIDLFYYLNDVLIVLRGEGLDSKDGNQNTTTSKGMLNTHGTAARNGELLTFTLHCEPRCFAFQTKEERKMFKQTLNFRF